MDTRWQVSWFVTAAADVAAASFAFHSLLSGHSFKLIVRLVNSQHHMYQRDHEKHFDRFLLLMLMLNIYHYCVLLCLKMTY
jgi:hypothetical protein